MSLNVLPVIFFIFVIMGLITVFVSKETIANLLGSKSGIQGILLGEIIGAVALIQPSAVYPFSGTLLNKGASYAVLYAFIGTAILIGVSTLPAEIKFLGKKFTLIRNLLTFLLIFIFSLFIHLIM
ncbi:MAG: permease [Caldisericia bacterium]|nr:permease [Caldisericia bacterium]